MKISTIIGMLFLLIGAQIPAHADKPDDRDGLIKHKKVMVALRVMEKVSSLAVSDDNREPRNRIAVRLNKRLTAILRGISDPETLYYIVRMDLVMDSNTGIELMMYSRALEYARAMCVRRLANQIDKNSVDYLASLLPGSDGFVRMSLDEAIRHQKLRLQKKSR